MAPSQETTQTAGLPRETNVGGKRFADFDLQGKTFLVTGGARGLGLALAEALVEAGGRGWSRHDVVVAFHKLIMQLQSFVLTVQKSRTKNGTKP